MIIKLHSCHHPTLCIQIHQHDISLCSIKTNMNKHFSGEIFFLVCFIVYQKVSKIHYSLFKCKVTPTFFIDKKFVGMPFAHHHYFQLKTVIVIKALVSKYLLLGYILVNLTHTTALDWHWGGDETLKLFLVYIAWLLLS